MVGPLPAELKFRENIEFLMHRPVNYASLTDGFIKSFSKVLHFDLECKHGKCKTAFGGQTVTGTFKKQAPGPNQNRV